MNIAQVIQNLRTARTEAEFAEEVPGTNGSVRQLSDTAIAQIVAAMEEAIRALDQQAPIIDEVHRRADKECCEEDQCDFTVTVTYEDYMALLS